MSIGLLPLNAAVREGMEGILWEKVWSDRRRRLVMPVPFLKNNCVPLRQTLYVWEAHNRKGFPMATSVRSLTISEGQHLQRLLRRGKDRTAILRALVVLMSAQGFQAREIAQATPQMP